MSNETYNTFWNIIKDNRIEIPTIQRDYTYGRKSAAIIREKLVTDIITSVVSKNALNLDFIYGKLFGKENHVSQERNKNSIQALLKTIKLYASDLSLEISDEVVVQDIKSLEKITFIPLDGQQRLTTLYLIHWYIIQLNRDKESLEILKKFTYSTRISSKEFCKMLTGKFIEFDSKTTSVSDEIRNNEEYFSNWRNDPTVYSMLSVIDEIHKIFKSHSVNYSECWNQLTKQNLITFDFFDLNDFELTDDLYIKMNARGRQLTDFEIFKAWLIKEHSDVIYVDDWKKNFDLKWYDLFWHVKETSSYKVDSEFMQFFKILFLADYMKSQNSEDTGMNDDSDLENYESDELNLSDFKSVIAVLRKKDSSPLDIFKKEELFRKNINNYLYLLDLVDFDFDTQFLLNKYIPVDLAKLLFGEKLNKLTWWDTTLHYAITRYLLEVEKNTPYINQWVRVISNLIYNSKIDTPKLFIEAIKSIDSLIDKIKTQSVYSVIASLTEDEILFFSSNQKLEEIQKSKLIIDEPKSDWESIFIEAENHNYFYGQVGFIFKLCGTTITMQDYKKNYEKVAALFSEQVLNDATFLLQRSFLSLEDCFYKEGDNRIFNSNARGTLRNRNENWRKFLDSKSSVIKTLITRPDYDQNAITKCLDKIIKNESTMIKDSYHGKFVLNYKLFNYPQKNTIRKIDRNYYLLNKTRLSGYFVELYTYDWFLINEGGSKLIPGHKIFYKYVKGQDGEPGVIFIKGKKKRLLLRNYKTGKYFFDTIRPYIEYDKISLAIQNI
jgi:hypothetical protein